MSYKLITVACPECGHKQTIEVVASCNNLFEKEEKEQILNLSTFLTKCEKCYCTYDIVYDCVYVNPVKKFYVYLDNRYNLLHSYNLVSGYKKEDCNGYRNYGATNGYDFIDKIVSLDNKLDPRLVELALDITRVRFLKDFPKEMIDNLYLVEPSNESKGRVTIKLLVDSKSKFFTTDYPSSVFKQIPRSIKTKLSKVTSLTFDRDDFLSIKDWTYKVELTK